MSKEIVYISGKITGEDFIDTLAKFERAEKYLKELGYDVINPLKIATNMPEFIRTDYGWIMLIDKALLRKANRIYMLKDWKYSNGAKEELIAFCNREDECTVMFEEYQ